MSREHLDSEQDINHKGLDAEPFSLISPLMGKCGFGLEGQTRLLMNTVLSSQEASYFFFRKWLLYITVIWELGGPLAFQALGCKFNGLPGCVYLSLWAWLEILLERKKRKERKKGKRKGKPLRSNQGVRLVCFWFVLFYDEAISCLQQRLLFLWAYPRGSVRLFHYR